MKIFLIGFMGSGKTTLGRKLANSLESKGAGTSYEFADMDELIEGRTGMTVAQYFEKYGEPAFRELEKEVLQNTEFTENTVIATGGGTPCFSDNMSWMNSNGITVYISLSPKGLVERLARGQAKRPLIKDLDKGDLLKFIKDRLASREVFYNQAKLTIDGFSVEKEKSIKDFINTGIAL